MRKYGISKYKEACKFFENYAENKSNYIFIHYARQNCFDESYAKGPRVIAIAVMEANDAQMRLFSLKKTSEELDIDFFSADNNDKDYIEKCMLEKFFAYAEVHVDCMWLHWNMKNNTFGFAALEERFEQLGGTPFHFDRNTHNISHILKKKYGENFAGNTKWNGEVAGKMYDIFELNNINDSEILNGNQEIKEFILQNITVIEQSTVAKVKGFQVIMDKALDNVLKTRSNILRDVYGLNIRGIIEYIHDNAVAAFLFSVFGGIIINLICRLIGI